MAEETRYLEPVERLEVLTLEDLLGGEERVRNIGRMTRDPEKDSGMIMGGSRPSITGGVLDFGIFLARGVGDNITPLEPNQHYLVVSFSSLVTGKRNEVMPIIVTGVMPVKESGKAIRRSRGGMLGTQAIREVRPVPAQIVRRSENGKWVKAEPDHLVFLDEVVKLMGLQQNIDKLVGDLHGDPSKTFVRATLESLWKIVGEANIDMVELLELARERPASDIEAELTGKMLKEVLVYRVFPPFEQGVKTIGFRHE